MLGRHAPAVSMQVKYPLLSMQVKYPLRGCCCAGEQVLWDLCWALPPCTPCLIGSS